MTFGKFGLVLFITSSVTIPGIAQYRGATPPPAEYAKGFDSIKDGRAKSILSFLAGPECEGRGTGQPGFQRAAEFVAKRFREAGLIPMGDNGTYFQNQVFYRTTATSFGIEDAKGRPLFAKGCVLNAPAHPVDITAPVVIVKAEDANVKLKEEDAKKLDGSIVLEEVPAGRSALRSQVALADTKAVFMIVDGSPLAAPVVRRTSGGGSVTVSGRVSKAVVKALDSKVGTFLDTDSSAVDASSASLIEVVPSAHLHAGSKTDEVLVPNVVGLLPGSDPVLKDEFVGIGGHLDHLGVVNGTVYPGADDDGSGSTAVMLIANAFAKNPKKPRRSILFMTFCGEEMGLLGSGYLSEHPPVPLAKMVSELQMDMVARDSYGVQNNDPNRVDVEDENRDTIRLVGSKRISTDLDRVIQQVNESIGFRFKYDAEDVYTRSDHYNFAKHGIPIAFLFDGFTPDYHQPTDTVDKIDFLKLTNAAKLYYLTANVIANNDVAPRHDVGQ
jgi:Peptidase family M28